MGVKRAQTFLTSFCTYFLCQKWKCLHLTVFIPHYTTPLKLKIWTALKIGTRSCRLTWQAHQVKTVLKCRPRPYWNYSQVSQSRFGMNTRLVHLKQQQQFQAVAGMALNTSPPLILPPLFWLSPLPLSLLSPLEPVSPTWDMADRYSEVQPYWLGVKNSNLGCCAAAAQSFYAQCVSLLCQV
jgi:hypothetical protein